MILIGCSTVCILAPIGVTIIINDLWVLTCILFFWGGCAWALYIIGLAMLGERFTGGTLTAVNAAYVVSYEIANIVGPPAAGFALSEWQNEGLMWLLGVTAAVFTILAVLRSLYYTKSSIDR